MGTAVSLVEGRGGVGCVAAAKWGTMRNLFASLALGVVLAMASVSAAASTLSEVRQRGTLRCGVSQGLAGFSSTDARGRWLGLDVDFCRAMAAAIFGDAEKVTFAPLSAKERFAALQAGEIDILSRNTTWNLTRDTDLGLDFLGVIYYDGQGFMVHKDENLKAAEELAGGTICTQSGTSTELNVADWFRARGLEHEILTFAGNDEPIAAYVARRCDAYTTDRSGLAAARLKLDDAAAHDVLPEQISKEPLGPVVRQGDAQWSDIGRWVLFALIAAEEWGLSSTTVEAERADTINPEKRRFLGLDGEAGSSLGLGRDWAYQVVRQVGNYGEIFERNVGKATPLALERGANALWRDGGLMYAPPFQ